MHHIKQIVLILFLGSLIFTSEALSLENSIDSSEPTRVYTGVGISAVSSEYDNGESLRELRGSINWAMTPDDMLQIESGYGQHDSNVTGGDDSGLTRTSLRYRQRLPFDESVQTGFLGMAFQAELQLSGEIRGTDGQTLFSGGTTPAIRISKSFDIYPIVNLVNSFDKNFKHYNGSGFDFAPRLTYTPSYLWPGAVVQIQPGYSKYLVGQLAFGNSSRVRIASSGTLFSVLQWTLSAERYNGLDLTTWRGKNSTGLKHDWSATFQLLATF